MFDVANSVFDMIMSPMAELPVVVSCGVLSVLIGILLLIVFKYISPQTRIAIVKDKMEACITGIVLFRDQPRIIVRCMIHSMLHALHYITLSIIPLTVMAIPMLLVLGEMNAYFDLRPIPVGDSTMVTLTYDDNAPADTMAKLIVPEGVTIVAEHRSQLHGMQSWKIQCDEPGNKPLTFELAGESIEKSLAVGDGHRLERISPYRFDAGFFDRLLYVSEAPLPENSPAHEIKIVYPVRAVELPSVMSYWVIWCFIVMTVSVFAFRGVLGVAI